MTTAAETATVKVWDRPVRLVHWSLVVLVVAAVVTAKMRGGAMVWHLRCGFAILTLVLFRILWGFAGSHHARFASFLRGPATVVDYASRLAAKRPPASVGHNPLGGWSVVALLVLLLLQAGTGLFANDDVMTDGPLVKFIGKDLSDTVTRYHQRNFWAIAVLVALHVAAVLFHLLALKDNLIRPMVTGVKELPRGATGGPVRETPVLRAIVLLALCAAAVWWLVTRR